MTHDQIIDIAIQEGFSGASVIDTSSIVFDLLFARIARKTFVVNTV